MGNGGVLYYDSKISSVGYGPVLLDMRGSWSPNFTNMGSAQPVDKASLSPASINKVDFMTRDGGTTIYGVGSYKGAEG